MGSAAVAADLAKADADCRAFAEAWRGKLAEVAGGPGAGSRLAEAVRQYEALEELLGRLISYAGLIYAGDNSDPARAKFYGDVQEQVTNASSHLLFFELELNRLDDALLDAALGRPGASVAGGPGSMTSARSGPTSSTTGWSSCSWRSRSPAAPPGTGCSTRPSRRSGSRSTAAN